MANSAIGLNFTEFIIAMAAEAAFLAKKYFAVIGASSDRSKFGLSRIAGIILLKYTSASAA
jgi:hypothetical protein